MSSQISFRKERQFSEPKNKARKHFFFFSQERSKKNNYGVRVNKENNSLN